MDELTDSLVTCMTGEEGRGGEDQDLGTTNSSLLQTALDQKTLLNTNRS